MSTEKSLTGTLDDDTPAGHFLFEYEAEGTRAHVELPKSLLPDDVPVGEFLKITVEVPKG